MAWKIAEPLPAVLVEVRLLLLKAPVRAPVPVLGSVPVVLGRVPLTPLLYSQGRWWWGPEAYGGPEQEAFPLAAKPRGAFRGRRRGCAPP